MKSIEKLQRQIGEKAKQERIKAGHNNYEYFAYENEINKKTIWKLENGRNVTLESFLRVLKALGKSPEEFFKGIK